MKWALVHLGSDIAYGMTFFAGELKRKGHDIKWFDGDEPSVTNKIISYEPSFACFGPLSSEYDDALQICKALFYTDIETVFGGHHVKGNLRDVAREGKIDHVVYGPCYDIIDKIISNSESRKLAAHSHVIHGKPVPVDQMVPELESYYRDVPRIGNRPRKYMMSHFGCVYNCSYCCTNVTRKAYGNKDYKKYWLTRRPVDTLINEALIAKKFGTKEISLADDDVFYAMKDENIDWLKEFISRWKSEVGLPLYANVTPITVLRTSKDLISLLGTVCDTVQMGFETSDKGSRKLFNRGFQNEEQVIDACRIMTSHGFKVKLEIIIGLPNVDGLVPDPLEDAIHTIQACQRINASVDGVIKAQCYPLILYPGTILYDKCMKQDIPTRDAWRGSFYEGVGSIVFNEDIENKIKNLVKMTTMFVKYNIDKEWIHALIEMNMTEPARRKLSECQYLDSLTFRLGDSVRDDFTEILKGMTFKY